MSSIIEQLGQWIEAIILTLSYPGITLVMFLENVFPPIPSELVMPYAGFLSASGKFNLAGVAVAGTLGSVLGAIVLYYVGLWANEPIIRSFVRRFGKWFMLSEQDLDKAMHFFDKHGEAVIFFGRLIPIVRSLISIPAGMDRMPIGKFLIFTTLGSAIWTTLLAVAGYILGANWERVIDFIEQYQRFTLVAIVIAVVGFFAFRLFQRRGRTGAPAVVKEPKK